MTTATLEQEIEALIQSEDYRVTVWAGGNNYIKLSILYMPRLSIRGTGGASCIANGIIAEQSFMNRSSRRRWAKARKWVLAEIAGHRDLLRTVSQA